MSSSASQWGFPTARRRALLIHGTSMCSNSWEGLAQLLVAKGFFVVAPNLLGHGGRRGTKYQVSDFAEDLQPYFATDTFDVIIGHSFGCPVTLSLLPFLPKPKETTIILVDSDFEFSEAQINIFKDSIVDWMTNVRTVEEHMAENPAWSRRDCVLRTMGIAMVDPNIIEVFQQNRPWSFRGLLKSIPPYVKVTALLAQADPEQYPRDNERLNVKVLTGVGHWIQYECPDAIMDLIPLPRAEL